MSTLQILIDSLITLGLGTFFVLFGTALAIAILKVYTDIDFEKSLYNDKTESKKDIPNQISVKIIVTIFAGVFFLLGVSMLGIFAII